MTPPTLSLPQLHEAIAAAQSRRAALSLPELMELRGQVNWLTSQAIFDPARKADLQAAMHALENGQQQHEKAREIDRELDTLKDKLQAATYENEQAKKHGAEQELNEAIDDFKSLAKQAVRTWRRIQRLNARNMQIKARTITMPGFHFACLSSGWNNGFSTSDELAMGLLPFEVSEKGN